MTDNEMIASLAAFFLEKFEADAVHVAETLDMSDDELKQLVEYAEGKGSL